MYQWYFSRNGQQTGPFNQDQAKAQAMINPEGYAWREGFAEWVPIREVGELNGQAPAPSPNQNQNQNFNLNQNSNQNRNLDSFSPSLASSSQSSDVIDFKIIGNEMQFVEVELDPEESAVAEAGAMMYKHPQVEMESVFGDGSKQSQSNSFFGNLLGAGQRLITGESLFTTVFTHKGSGKAHVAFAAPYPGNIIPIMLPNVGGTLICQKDSFLCAAKGVSIGLHFQRKILTGLFGGEGFIMQKLEGDGLVFVHAGGTVVERVLNMGETLHVDTGCVVAMEASVDFDIQKAGGIKTMLFGGEGLFFATLQGPGKIWLQSLPFSRLAGRMLAAAPQTSGFTQGEGSILGNVGGFLDGDNF